MSESQFSPIADQIRAAGTHAERAQNLLKLSDAVVLSAHGDLEQACADTNFTAGACFVRIRVTALCRVRDAHGLLPSWIAYEAELWRSALSTLAAGGHIG